MKLFSYFRSSAAWRVRIALHLKQLGFETVPVHLLRNGGEQRAEAYRQVNPQGLVPFLEDGELAVGQSMAILEYLEERYPQPALLPADAAGRARVRAFAQHIACDIHPLNNLRVLQYLTGPAGLSEDAKLAWYRHWISEGFRALELALQAQAGQGPYCFGERITLADVCLVPQVFNAQRFQCDLSAFPRIVAVAAVCGEHPAFVAAHPAQQPDAE